MNPLVTSSSYSPPSPYTSNQSQSLPSGWEERRDEQGRVYFIDHNTKTTTWNRPVQTYPAIVTAFPVVTTGPLKHSWVTGILFMMLIILRILKGFCDCLNYREPDGTLMCCPYFFPMGLLGTCFLLGKIRTL